MNNRALFLATPAIVAAIKKGNKLAGITNYTRRANFPNLPELPVSGIV